jgi:hypothetical protein
MGVSEAVYCFTISHFILTFLLPHPPDGGGKSVGGLFI